MFLLRHGRDEVEMTSNNLKDQEEAHYYALDPQTNLGRSDEDDITA